jgi:hypothetical protein
VNSSNQLLSGANAGQDNAVGIWYSANNLLWAWCIDGVTTMFAPNSVVEDGLWHHVGYVRSGASAMLFIDGAMIGSSVAVSAAAFDVGAGGLFIGQDQDTVGGMFDASQNWTGEIDNLRIYKRALSAAEIVLARDEPR